MKDVCTRLSYEEIKNLKVGETIQEYSLGYFYTVEVMETPIVSEIEIEPGTMIEKVSFSGEIIMIDGTVFQELYVVTKGFESYGPSLYKTS